MSLGTRCWASRTTISTICTLPQPWRNSVLVLPGRNWIPEGWKDLLGGPQVYVIESGFKPGLAHCPHFFSLSPESSQFLVFGSWRFPAIYLKISESTVSKETSTCLREGRKGPQASCTGYLKSILIYYPVTLKWLLIYYLGLH